MALQTSGQIKLSEIQAEFGGSNPIGISEYYLNGPYTTSNNTGVPTSGEITSSDFYGTTAWTSGSQTFYSSGTFTPPSGTNTSTVFTVTLVAGGGGGGGGEGNGGGGGGGYVSQSVTGLTGANVTVTIGGGGGKGCGDKNWGGWYYGTNGGSSSFGSFLSATGGVRGTPIQDGCSGGTGGSPGGGNCLCNYGSSCGSNGGAAQGGQGAAGARCCGAGCNASNGGNYGGGGGGGGWSSGCGGNGAPGRIIVSW